MGGKYRRGSRKTRKGLTLGLRPRGRDMGEETAFQPGETLKLS